MSEYNIEFAQAMAESSFLILQSESMPQEAHRAALYTALVSCEMSMKYVLNVAGVTVPKTHDLQKLLGLISECTVEDNVVNGRLTRVPATRIRSEEVLEGSDVTLGHLLEAESVGASKFPNEIRYGHILKHYPASMMQMASIKLIGWVKRYETTIKA